MKKQNEIIKELNVRENQTDIPDIVTERVELLKDVLLASKTNSLILGISGGVDSLTAGLLAQQAVDELNDQGHHMEFIAVKLPYASQADAKYVELALNVITPNKIEMCDIYPLVNTVEMSLDDAFSKHGAHEKDFIRGNVKARSRMLIQYTLANCYNGLVIGTDHAAEAVTGFFTKFGDGACDVTPLSGLTKKTVRNIAKWYGAPEELYDKEATADLEDLRVNLSDEDALGITYDDIDTFLSGGVVSRAVEAKIIERYENTIHKRQLPITVESDDVNQPTDYAYTIERDDFPSEIVSLFKCVEKYAKRNKETIANVIGDIDKVSTILENMEDDGVYSHLADEFAIWYINSNQRYNLSFECKNNKITRLSFGTAMIAHNTNELVDVINSRQKSLNESLDGISLGVKPTIKTL